MNRRSTRALIVPAIFMGSAPGLVAMAVLFKLGMPYWLAGLCGLSAGTYGALMLLKKL